MPKATDHPITAISCADLARLLPALHEQNDALNAAVARLAHRAQERHTMQQSCNAIAARIEALEDLVLATPAATLADAAAQILVAANRIRRDCSGAGGRAEAEPEKAERALHSAMFVVAVQAGLDLDEVGFTNYAPYTARPNAAALAAA